MKISKRMYRAGIAGMVAMCCIGLYGWSLRQEVNRIKSAPCPLDHVVETGNGLQIPQGLTALTVPSDDTLGVGGALVSGSRVNVYSVADGAAHLLDQGVLVVETSSFLGSEEKKTTRTPLSWVTLAVRGEQVEEMLAASKSGSLYLTLPALGSSLGGAAGSAALDSLESTTSGLSSDPAGGDAR